MVLDCCNASGVLMSASATPKSALTGNATNMKPTYSAKVACGKEKAEFSMKQTNKHVMSRKGKESQQIL